MMDIPAGWFWAIAGLVLLIAEAIAPGFFLIFLGVAAIATGLFTLLFDLSLAPQLVLFITEGVFISMICANWQARPRARPRVEHAVNLYARDGSHYRAPSIGLA